ncbi:MAG: WYL domain-containing protein [Bacteroidales bacterium]|nr:WYL domain-containing protein [Bacteroidales bacterium]
MTNQHFGRYVWLVDTLKRHGRLTLKEINEKWVLSPLSNNEGAIPRRTFYNYRNAISEMFHIDIECDPATNEYYIAQEDEHLESLTNWLFNSTATSELITSARDVAGRVFIDDVPSAREHLAVILEGLKDNSVVRFDYHPYTRSLPTTGILLEPYFTKIFKQRWYVIGRNVKEDKIKTYALDRMRGAQLMPEHFQLPEDFDPKEYFRYAFGIVVDKGEPRDIEIRTEPMQAKYWRALPLHPSQQEMVQDGYSVFHFRMRVTQDLVTELLSLGSKIEVLKPRELRAIMRDQLRQALAAYDK